MAVSSRQVSSDTTSSPARQTPLTALAGYFALLSLFAVGGANAAIPEMHRVAVELMHWMNDRQFADSYAIAQLSPGPNVIIVTLIGTTTGIYIMIRVPIASGWSFSAPRTQATSRARRMAPGR